MWTYTISAELSNLSLIIGISTWGENQLLQPAGVYIRQAVAAEKTAKKTNIWLSEVFYIFRKQWFTLGG